MKFYLGVDVGGSKTHALVADMDSGRLSLGVGPGGNPESAGFSGMLESMRIAINDAKAQLPQEESICLGAGFGVAGFDWESDRAPISEGIEKLELGCPFRLENDSLLPLWTASTVGEGIAASAGTGNNVRGRWHDGRSGRITGNSLRNGEFGGASELVFLAIQQLSYAWTLRWLPGSASSRLEDIFLALTGAADLADLLEGIIRDRYQLSPSVAPLILQAAQDGDEMALKVVQRNADELAFSVLAVARQMEIDEQPFDLVLSGSLLQHSPFYQNVFLQSVQALLPNARGILLDVPPVVGALMMALANDRESSKKVSEQLLEVRKMMAKNGWKIGE
ncbi:MAG: hypothetical protein BGO78_10760 [Chloroflexi bacterium 44-23]|nr:MAG: hypothetical protein BGO78_10760 [Chloroflexi bacterium 44-23]